MRIARILHRSVPIKSAIRNAVVDFSEMTASIVAIVSDVQRDGRPLVGYGFNSNGRYGQDGIIRDRLLPRIFRAAPEELLDDTGRNFDPFKWWDIMMRNEKPGGHGERSVAVGTIDMALWDLVAKIEGKPLYKTLADRFSGGRFNNRIYTYAAGGYYYPGKDLAALQDEMKSYLDLGYESVKMKIGGVSLREDMARIEAVLKVVGDGSHLAVDANGRFDLKTALEYSRAMEPLDLKWFEEAGDPLDFRLQAELSQVSCLPMATGENLFSMVDTRNLIRHAGLNSQRDFIQVDPVLSYGLVEYLRILDMLRAQGWSPGRCIPHGGHQLTLHIAAAFGLYGNESYPGVFQPFGGFADGVPIQDGYVTIPDCPGIGIEAKGNLQALFEELSRTI
jgi:L-alanine-DL-glutamate epimerase-like enolase superfamily enzyme